MRSSCEIRAKNSSLRRSDSRSARFRSMKCPSWPGQRLHRLQHVLVLEHELAAEELQRSERDRPGRDGKPDRGPKPVVEGGLAAARQPAPGTSSIQRGTRRRSPAVSGSSKTAPASKGPTGPRRARRWSRSPCRPARRRPRSPPRRRRSPIRSPRRSRPGRPRRPRRARSPPPLRWLPRAGRRGSGPAQAIADVARHDRRANDLPPAVLDRRHRQRDVHRRAPLAQVHRL